MHRRQKYEQLANHELFHRIGEGATIKPASLSARGWYVYDSLVDSSSDSGKYRGKYGKSPREAMIHWLIAYDPNPPESSASEQLRDAGFPIEEEGGVWVFENTFFGSEKEAAKNFLKALNDYADEKIEEALANHPVLRFFDEAKWPVLMGSAHTGAKFSARGREGSKDRLALGYTEDEAASNWLKGCPDDTD